MHCTVHNTAGHNTCLRRFGHTGVALVLQGVLYGLTRKGRVLIADEMGVGKTVQALALAACYQVSEYRAASPVACLNTTTPMCITLKL